MTLKEKVEYIDMLNKLFDYFWQFTGKTTEEELNAGELGYYNKIKSLYDQNTKDIRNELDLL